MLDDFYRLRRNLTPREPAPPEPIGWNPDGTVTGNPRPRGVGTDPHDCAPSRNPYPRSMPSLRVEVSGPAVPAHARALRHVEKVAFDGEILLAAGDLSRLRDVQTAILRRKALAEELGTGVVMLSPAEEELLRRDLGDEPQAAAA
jgi:hypothetical protein